MNKRLHVNVKLNIKNPYVMMLSHSTSDYSVFRKILTRAKDLCNGGTWGYSNITYEPYYAAVPFTSTLCPEITYRSYWAFADKQDALQFKITFGEMATQVIIWPSNIKFTITEMVDEP